MHYLKLFGQHGDYESFINGGTMLIPNVSYCVSGDMTHYNPNVDDPYRIVFVDEEVERICVENFSSNDKYLTYEDAEKVRYIDDVFKGNTAITSFDEFKYFKNVDTDYSFSGCTNLTSITLSENITRINHSHFAKCNNLKKITLLAETPPRGNRGSVVYGGYSYYCGPLSRKNLTYNSTDNRPIYVYVPEASVGAYNAAHPNDSNDTTANWLCDGITSVRIAD